MPDIISGSEVAAPQKAGILSNGEGIYEHSMHGRTKEE